MLFEYIERARNQPKEVRQRLVWVWSIALTGIIVLVWLSVIIGKQYAERGGVMREVLEAEEQTPQDTRSQFNEANQFLNTQVTNMFESEFTPATFEDVTRSTSSTTPAEQVSDTQKVGTSSPRNVGTSSAPLWP